MNGRKDTGALSPGRPAHVQEIARHDPSDVKKIGGSHGSGTHRPRHRRNARHWCRHLGGPQGQGLQGRRNYGGNDEAANAFKAETGIPVFKFDVGDGRRLRSRHQAVEAEVGPIDILVNNAGITRDGAFTR